MPTSAQGGDSPAKVAAELKTLLTGYARQEIVGPLSQVGKALKFGILGALGIGVGLVFIAVAGLRLLQTEASGVFGGNMSAVPYVIVLIGLVLVCAVTFGIRTRTQRGDSS